VASTNLNPKDMKEIASSIRESSVSYQEFGKTLERCTEETKPLKPLIGKPGGEAGLKDSRLVKAGIALILFPDPTISDLVGYTLVAAGYLKNRMKRSTAADVCRELQETMKTLKELTLNLGH
jgi:hypothetical protein